MVEVRKIRVIIPTWGRGVSKTTKKIPPTPLRLATIGIPEKYRARSPRVLLMDLKFDTLGSTWGAEV